jgi:molybdopterin/thiamine biosynthesis adenylyltransferase
MSIISKFLEIRTAGCVVDINEPLRLRPSVSVIPTSDSAVIEFFQGNTRRVKHLKIKDPRIIDIVSALNGHSAAHLSEIYADIREELLAFLSATFDWCFIEYVTIGNTISGEYNYRTLNFLADYFPSDELLSAYSKLQESNVLVVGCGGVGSLIAKGLARFGIKFITVCDPDVVKPHNLNRGAFTRKDLLLPKVRALADAINKEHPDCRIKQLRIELADATDAEQIIPKNSKYNLVINAADHPNVDTTSKLLFPLCMEQGIPHIVAGGYNLHLSLIGPTILPFESACYRCIEMGLDDQLEVGFSRLRKLVRPNRNIGNIAPLATISASYTLNEALKTLLSGTRLAPTMIGKRGEFNYIKGKAEYSIFPRRSDCTWCGAQAVKAVRP